ncbi:hypothetical protein HGH92_26420 [Chitinophaga varians]|uniref:Resolvase/invertase-type recombinase catalytic domain-containing protein n=1 Tax=Chitinophaga varians TaxID=2202339 RepID=A0A847S4U8_9BACT|nr:hypothetical protein [Chitinophaga varians]NLR67867.1 hypothetical protein [Chitinophaga varians]
MKKADIYLRGQSDSQFAIQKALVEEYCVKHNITIRKILYDSGAGKSDSSFWNDYIIGIRLTPGAIDLLIFTEWSRISRDIGEMKKIKGILSGEKIIPLAINESILSVFFLKWTDFQFKICPN